MTKKCWGGVVFKRKLKQTRKCRKSYYKKYQKFNLWAFDTRHELFLSIWSSTVLSLNELPHFVVYLIFRHCLLIWFSTFAFCLNTEFFLLLELPTFFFRLSFDIWFKIWVFEIFLSLTPKFFGLFEISIFFCRFKFRHFFVAWSPKFSCLFQVSYFFVILFPNKPSVGTFDTFSSLKYRHILVCLSFRHFLVSFSFWHFLGIRFWHYLACFNFQHFFLSSIVWLSFWHFLVSLKAQSDKKMRNFLVRLIFDICSSMDISTLFCLADFQHFSSDDLRYFLVCFDFQHRMFLVAWTPIFLSLFEI